MTKFYAYSDGIYWALTTMTSTGYGDIKADTTNKLEMIVASLVMLMGKMVLGHMLGNIASTLANMDMQRVLSEAKYNGVISHMKDLRMPDTIQKRVVAILQYMWRRNQGTSMEGLFDGLPSCLHGELSLDLIGGALKSVAHFKNCGLPFIKALCSKMQLLQYFTNEYIFRKGDIGSDIYFIKSGHVEIEQDDDLIILSEGEVFGNEFFLKHAARSYSVRAGTHVDLFHLRESDLDDVLRTYPNEAIKVRENVAEETRRGSFLGEDRK